MRPPKPGAPPWRHRRALTGRARKALEDQHGLFPTTIGRNGSPCWTRDELLHLLLTHGIRPTPVDPVKLER